MGGKARRDKEKATIRLAVSEQGACLLLGRTYVSRCDYDLLGRPSASEHVKNEVRGFESRHRHFSLLCEKRSNVLDPPA